MLKRDCVTDNEFVFLILGYPKASAAYVSYCLDDAPAGSTSLDISADDISASGMSGGLKFFVVFLVFSVLAVTYYSLRKYQEDPNFLYVIFYFIFYE